MRHEKELLKNTIILSIGKILPQLLSVITIPLLTYYLSMEEYGTYDLINTIVSLLLPIATLQIQSAAFRFLIENRGNKEKEQIIISNIFCFTVIVSSLILIAFYSVLSIVSVTIKISICAYLLVDVLYNTLGQIVRGLSYNKKFAIGSVIFSVVKTLVIFINLYFIKSGLLGALAAIIVAYIVAVVYMARAIGLKEYIVLKYIDKNVIKEMLLYSWPMVPNNLSSWVLKISDRLVITFFLGIEANAMYAAANNIPNIINVAKSVFIMAWQENASIVSKAKDASEYYTKMFDVTFSIIGSVTSLLFAATPLLFKLLIKGSYKAAYTQMPILFLGVFFGCMSAFQGGIYIAYMRTKNVGITTMISAIINVVIDIALVDVIGITAGSISTLISYLFLFLYRMFDVKKFQKIEYNYGRLLLQIMFLVMMAWFCYLQYWLLDFINIVAAVLFVFVFNKDILANIYTALMEKLSDRY